MYQVNKLFLLLSLTFFFAYSFTLKPEAKNMGVIQLRTLFYDSSNVLTFQGIIKVWFSDSVSVEEINITKQHQIGSSTTVTFEPLLYRFIDLSSKVMYDYKNFSDTAVAFNKALLPDSIMKDYGWSYYSNKVRQIDGQPLLLSDTVVENINYKRIKFNFIGDDSHKGYQVGYMRCDGKGKMFSLEKKYSGSINCAMTKFEDFEFGKSKPSVVMEIEFVTDTLNANEQRVIEAWKRNVKK